MTPTDAENYRAVLIHYLVCKVKEADWHAVGDAANDIRELEAEHKHLRSIPV